MTIIPALTTFTVQLYVLVWKSYEHCNLFIVIFPSFLQFVSSLANLQLISGNKFEVHQQSDVPTVYVLLCPKNQNALVNSRLILLLFMISCLLSVWSKFSKQFTVGHFDFASTLDD